MHNRPHAWRALTAAWLAATAASCATQAPPPDEPLPSVAPATQPTTAFELGGAEIRPMYREMVAIDLQTAARVAVARGIDVRQARERVDASRGRYEASVEAILPVITPSLTYQHLSGANQNANGTLVFT